MKRKTRSDEKELANEKKNDTELIDLKVRYNKNY